MKFKIGDPAIRADQSPPRHFPAIEGFDLNAGPEGLDEPRLVRRSRILGNMRQELPTEWLPELFRSESLSDDLKDEISREIGPDVRGGEDLPPLSERQMELVRFRYGRTVHQEAWSFRATQGSERIYFRVEDEYELDTEPALKSVRSWPSLGKLIWILDRTVIGAAEGLYFGDLTLRLENEVSDPEELRDFILASSFFYPAIGEWYAAAFEAWCRAIAAGADLAWPVDSISLMAAM
jgi:hypothetical protein